MISEKLLKEAKQLKETLIFNRRYLHSHAGTGFERNARLCKKGVN